MDLVHHFNNNWRQPAKEEGQQIKDCCDQGSIVSPGIDNAAFAVIMGGASTVWTDFVLVWETMTAHKPLNWSFGLAPMVAICY